MGENKLDKFKKRHANSRAAIDNWLETVKKAQWKSLIDVKNTFNTADYVKNRVVFDLGGNNFRVIAVVEYIEGMLHVREVMTHAEYDRWKP